MRVRVCQGVGLPSGPPCLGGTLQTESPGNTSFFWEDALGAVVPRMRVCVRVSECMHSVCACRRVLTCVWEVGMFSVCTCVPAHVFCVLTCICVAVLCMDVFMGACVCFVCVYICICVFTCVCAHWCVCCVCLCVHVYVLHICTLVCVLCEPACAHLYVLCECSCVCYLCEPACACMDVCSVCVCMDVCCVYVLADVCVTTSRDFPATFDLPFLCVSAFW